jgi:hypothetical protein
VRQTTCLLPDQQLLERVWGRHRTGQHRGWSIGRPGMNRGGSGRKVDRRERPTGTRGLPARKAYRQEGPSAGKDASASGKKRSRAPAQLLFAVVCPAARPVLMRQHPLP